MVIKFHIQHKVNQIPAGNDMSNVKNQDIRKREETSSVVILLTLIVTLNIHFLLGFDIAE